MKTLKFAFEISWPLVTKGFFSTQMIDWLWIYTIFVLLPEKKIFWEVNQGHKNKWSSIFFGGWRIRKHVPNEITYTIYIWVSVKGVRSHGGHFACLCREFDIDEVKKNIIIFQTEKGNTFKLLIILICSEKSSKRAKKAKRAQIYLSGLMKNRLR